MGCQLSKVIGTEGGSVTLKFEYLNTFENYNIQCVTVKNRLHILLITRYIKKVTGLMFQ